MTKITRGNSITDLMVNYMLVGPTNAGEDIAAILLESDIAPDILKHPKAFVPLEKVSKLYRQCTVRMGDEAHGFLHRPFPIGTFRMLGLVMLHSSTLGMALRRCVEFLNLFENSFQYSFVVEKGVAEVSLERLPNQPLLDVWIIDYLLSFIHRFAGWLCDVRIALNQVHVDFPMPGYHSDYDLMYYGAPTRFSCKNNGIKFSEEYLQEKIVQSEVNVEHYIRRIPLDTYLPMNAGGILTRTIRGMIKDVLNDEARLPSLERVSLDLKLNPQTLRRRLKAEDTSFHDIKEQVRREFAIHHLANLDLRIEEIAGMAGYTEPGSFIRAFKSWNGCTPLQFRKEFEFQ